MWLGLGQGHILWSCKTMIIVSVGLNLIQAAEEQLPTLQHLLALLEWWQWGCTGRADSSPSVPHIWG